MKPLRLPLVLSIVFLVGGLFVLWRASENPHSQKLGKAMSVTAEIINTNRGIPFSLEDIPRFPDNQKLPMPLPSNSKLGGRWIGTEYETTGSVEEIVQFYKTALAQTGWYGGEGNTDATAPYHIFRWPYSQDKAPYRLDLTLQLSPSVFGHGKQNVRIGFLRIPDATKIPTYSGATQQRVQYSPSQDAGGYGTRITSYVTNANLSELKQFYVSLLENLGWKLVEDKSSTNNGITYTFNFQEITFHQVPLWGEAVIIATPDQSGQTRVELRVKGWNIRDELQKEQE